MAPTEPRLSGLIATNAPIQAGDSGGTLVDTAGRVLGMDTAGSSHFAFSQGTAEGFAIPTGTVTAIGAQIERSESSTTVHIGPTAFLGVEAANFATSAVVVEVLPGTPAAAIGLGEGDTIVSLGGQTIHGPTTLSHLLQAERPGATVPISWRSRFNQPHTAMVTLVSGPPA